MGVFCRNLLTFPAAMIGIARAARLLRGAQHAQEGFAMASDRPYPLNEEHEGNFTELRGYEPGDEPPCNQSSNRTFYEIAEARLGRRAFLAGGLAAAVTTVFGNPLAMASSPRRGANLLGFEPIPTSDADVVRVPRGYKVAVILAAGEPIAGTFPPYSLDSTGEQQAMQVGSHHDGMHFFPIDGSSSDGLMVLNHEYIEPRFLHRSHQGMALDADDVIRHAEGGRDADEVLKEMHAHGVSLCRIARNGVGVWSVTPDVRNRRITALTPIAIGGPVRGSAHVRTKYSPDGTMTRGTLNNCAHGVTPWNTYLAAEENWAGYFTNRDTRDGEPSLPREHARYGVRTKPSRYRWELAEGGADQTTRFDATSTGADATEDYRNEPNCFGWMVEIDPFDPNSVPVKRTYLGRFAHEGVIFAPAVAGRPVVCYSGDDARFEYIYKFVSARRYDPSSARGDLLDEGTLYVAKFNEDGSGEWLPLAHGQRGLTPENGFADQADILVNTRLAADFVGATKMDRPEWGAVDPNTGEVYFTLTNNTQRQPEQTDGANPRAFNAFGHIVRWKEAGGMHEATSFAWDLFVLGGDAEEGRDGQGRHLDARSIFACPDGLWFDPDGRLWIQTDIGESVMNRGIMEVFGNNQMLAADPKTGELRRFLTGPVGQEITGVVMTPDQRTMFVNVQHPGATTTREDFAAGRFASVWPGGAGSIPRSATLVITREDGGKIGA